MKALGIQTCTLKNRCGLSPFYIFHLTMGQKQSHQAKSPAVDGSLTAVVPTGGKTTVKKGPSVTCPLNSVEPIQPQKVDPLPLLTISSLNEETFVPTLPATTAPENQQLGGIPDTCRKSQKIAAFGPICSQVYSHVFVGGKQVAMNVETLRNHRITHIINASSEVVPNAFEHEFDYLTLTLRDGVSEDLSPFFFQVLEYIESAVKANPENKVFIHCHQGVSRSCSFVLAYMIWKEGLSFQRAFEQLKAIRGVCSPNSAFICQLLEFHHLVNQTTSTPTWYRIEPHHSEYDPSTLVVKACLAPDTRHPRGYARSELTGVVILVLSAENQAYVWYSHDTETTTRFTDIQALAQKWIQQWFKYTATRSALPEIKIIPQGQESTEFQSYLEQESALPLASHLNRETPASCSDELPHEITSDSSHNSNDSMTGSTSVAVYLFYSLDSPGERLNQYDSDDLLQDATLVVISPTLVFIWIGQEVAQHHQLSTTNEAEHQRFHSVFSPVLARQSEMMHFPPSKVEYIVQGQETPDFWTVFESGY